MYFYLLVILCCCFEFVSSQNITCSWVSRAGATLTLTIATQIKQEGCNLINSDVEVDSSVTHLKDLENINTITGYLLIQGNGAISNLEGLENLTSIGRYLELENIDSLLALESVALLKIIGNSELKNIYGLNNLKNLGSSPSEILGNTNLQCDSVCNENIMWNLNMLSADVTQQCLLDSNIVQICNSSNYTLPSNQTCDGPTQNCLYCSDINCQPKLQNPQNFCGDNVIDFGEECDFNISQTFNCPYGAINCTFCNFNCKFQIANSSYCGDGKLDTIYEECDDLLSQNCNNCSVLTISESQKTDTQTTVSQSSLTSHSVIASHSNTISQSNIDSESNTDSYCKQIWCEISDIIFLQNITLFQFNSSLILHENIEIFLNQKIILNYGNLILKNNSNLKLNLNSFLPIDIKNGCLDGTFGDLNVHFSQNIDFDKNNEKSVDLISYKCFKKFKSITINSDSECFKTIPMYSESKLSILVKKNSNCSSGCIQRNTIINLIVTVAVILNIVPF